jgi:Rrf2 family protein
MVGQNAPMRVPAKVDYAIQAAAELTAADPAQLTSDHIAKAQHIPAKYLGNILVDLSQAGIVASHHGADGGYQLARPADQITLADIIRAADGPLARSAKPDPNRSTTPSRPPTSSTSGSPPGSASAASWNKSP